MVAPTVAPQIFSEPTDTSEVALNAAPDTSTNTIQIPRTEGRAPTVVGR